VQCLDCPARDSNGSGTDTGSRVGISHVISSSNLHVPFEIWELTSMTWQVEYLVPQNGESGSGGSSSSNEVDIVGFPNMELRCDADKLTELRAPLSVGNRTNGLREEKIVSKRRNERL